MYKRQKFLRKIGAKDRMREQMAYFQKLRDMRVAASEGIALLDLAPDVEPLPEDALPKPAVKKRRRA